jgi:hypothetical protein
MATEYDGPSFNELLHGSPDFFDGYLLIECRKELDVVGVYTGAALPNGVLVAMHMERVPARKIPVPKDFKIK